MTAVLTFWFACADSACSCISLLLSWSGGDSSLIKEHISLAGGLFAGRCSGPVQQGVYAIQGADPLQGGIFHYTWECLKHMQLLMKWQTKLSGTATSGFLIQLESNIQLRRGCICYLKDGIFLKVLIWLSIYPCLNPEEKQTLMQCCILSGIPLLICHTAPGIVTMKRYERSLPLAKGAKDDCVSVLS